MLNLYNDRDFFKQSLLLNQRQYVNVFGATIAPCGTVNTFSGVASIGLHRSGLNL